MFQASTFRPTGGQGFLPQVRMAGFQPAPVRRPAPGPVMGYSLEDGKHMYEQAKAAVANFDALAVKASKINYKPTRDQIIADYGLLEPLNKDKALYMRGTLQDYIVQVEASNPLNYYVFIQDTSRPRNRLSWLESNNVSFASAVNAAEATYGLTPEPQVIIREIQVPGAAAAAGTDLTVPIAVGAGAIVLALLIA